LLHRISLPEVRNHHLLIFFGGRGEGGDENSITGFYIVILHVDKFIWLNLNRDANQTNISSCHTTRI